MGMVLGVSAEINFRTASAMLMTVTAVRTKFIGALETLE